MEPRVENEMIRVDGILDWYLTVGLSGIIATYTFLLINHISEG